MALALLFAGQGSQHPAMLPWLEGQPAAAEALQALGQAVGRGWRDRLGDPDWAATNRVAQPLLTATGLAAWHCLAPLLPAPDIVAGYSVGELAACAAAGVVGPEAALALAAERAALMDAAPPGGLLAVQGIAPGARAQLAAAHGLELAIDACAGTALFGGPLAAVDAALGALAHSGLRVTRLPIRVASHTALMREAAAAFGARLQAHAFAVPAAPVACNLTGAATRAPEQLRDCLAGQLAATVQWRACMQTLAERGVTCVLEIGPGSALSRMVAAAHPHIAARSADAFRSPQGCAAWVRAALARG